MQGAFVTSNNGIPITCLSTGFGKVACVKGNASSSTDRRNLREVLFAVPVARKMTELRVLNKSIRKDLIDEIRCSPYSEFFSSSVLLMLKTSINKS